MIKNRYEDWTKIPWKRIHLEIYNLQYKIYCHAKKNKIGLVRNCQRELVKSPEAKLLAVRQVTQDNRGKTTAGVDGISRLKPSERLKLAHKLRFDGKASKIRRVFIPKSNGKIRPLGIPTMEDRAKQMLMKLALEPEWEARFETNSYGFRPGYSTADAKWCIARQLQGGPKYFLDADIEKCFDEIDHKHLIKQLNTITMFEKQIWNWLKAGIMDYTEKDLSEINEKGSPQGGVLSPLLMNIALHGMETYVTKIFGRNKLKLIRYADDFVIFAKTLKDIHTAKKRVSDFLEPIGLRLSEEKTFVGHSMKNDPKVRRPRGLNFLSYHFRNIECSKHRGVKNTRGVTQPFRLITRPSRESIINHKKAIKSILAKYKGAPLGRVIERLSSRIRGWTWYQSVTQSTKTFSKLDGWLWLRLWRWAKKRYRGAKNAKQKCFNVKGWSFGFKRDDQTFILKRHDQTKIRKHIKIKANSSIFNGELAYFAKRLSKSNPRINALRSLFEKQNYSCPHCDLYLLSEDIIEVHHVLDGKDRTGEIQLMHGHCHDLVHSPKCI